MKELDSLLSSSLVSKHGTGPHSRSRLATLGLQLPRAHLDLLATSDGVMGYGGYFRIFGVTNAVTDMRWWNQEDTWKFAWKADVREFVCFGETAWGDQYAYRSADLRSDMESPVYFLESTTLRPEKIASDFGGFLKNEFLRNCEAPYDEMVVAARKKLGDVAPSEHITYVPSLLITGEESLEHVTKMPARSAMIANGDLARQLSGELQSRPIAAIEPYIDEKNRSRLRVLWG